MIDQREERHASHSPLQFVQEQAEPFRGVIRLTRYYQKSRAKHSGEAYEFQALVGGCSAVELPKWSIHVRAVEQSETESIECGIGGE